LPSSGFDEYLHNWTVMNTTIKIAEGKRSLRYLNLIFPSTIHLSYRQYQIEDKLTKTQNPALMNIAGKDKYRWAAQVIWATHPLGSMSIF
jgi:hypothetical protein